MVVAQRVERSLPTPEIRGSNPVIGSSHTESARPHQHRLGDDVLQKIVKKTEKKTQQFLSQMIGGEKGRLGRSGRND